MKRRNAQGLLEYLLIFAMIAVVSLGFVTKFDLSKIRNHVFDRPADTANPSRITIEPMTQ